MSKVIKNFDSSAHSEASRAFDMAEVGDEAAEIIATAEEIAARILEDAKAEAEAMLKRARLEGLDQGKAAVRGRVEQQLEEEIRKARSREVANLVKTLQTLISEVNDWRDTLARDSKEQLISLAINIARSVVKREVKCSRDVARLNVEEAIRLSARRSKLLIRVSEMDMTMLETLLGEGPFVRDSDSAVALVPSSEILPGGCLIESPSGSVDARVETQLREIEKVLLEGPDNG